MKDLDWSFIKMDLKNHMKFRFEILVIQLLSKVWEDSEIIQTHLRIREWPRWYSIPASESIVSKANTELLGQKDETQLHRYVRY